MAHRAPSSSITYKWTYDVFLSFRGQDTRLGFISSLYESLRQSGIHAFIDDKIRDGENITRALVRAIEESRIAIIVFSVNYANSTFCLQELVKILECFKEESRLIYPVFYYVDPSELRRPRGSYAEALTQLEERFKDDTHKVKKWRQALSQAADHKGCHLEPKIANEHKCITRITSEVAARINLKPLHVTNYPVGLVSRVKKVISCLDLGSTKEIKMIGIWGAGGIGKSTIARAVYNSIADNFEGLCFLFDVRKQSKVPNGLSHLQEKLLCRLVMENDFKLGDYHEGIPIIEHRLSQKKILLILDDVDESDQLKALAGSCDWFGYGSRIIITTRNKQLLVSHGIKSIYDVKELIDEESLKLLSWYAFEKENMDSNYVEVCNRAVDYSCGFPLALEVIGSHLRNKGVNIWSSALTQFKTTPNERVLDALKLSYDTLGKVEKQVFLDLACFFNGEKLATVIDILLCVRAIEPKYAIDMLIDKSLVKIEQGHVKMHDLREDVGKEIVRQESSDVLGEQSRLWSYDDILHVLQEDMGTDKIEAIFLDLPENEEVQWSGEEFMKMKKLKMLVIRKARFSGCPKYLPNSLRWLEWKEYPFEFLPYQERPTKLVYLDLSHSTLELLQPFDKKFPNLSSMNLTKCKFVRQIPNLSGASNLTELWLDGCINLVEIHDSVGCLNNLRELSAMRCKNLKIFPPRLSLTSLKHLNLFGCSSLQRFPEISVMMKEMQILDLDNTGITELPHSICNLIGLEILSMEECPDLKQLPASICTLPNLWKLTAKFCEGMRYFKMCEGGEASSDCSAMSLKMEQLCFSNCNLSNDSLAFCLCYFTNMIHLDLSFNNFTALPKCIKEYHNLKYLFLDNCNQLCHIGGMPPNLEKFSAIYCSSLTESSKSKVLKQAFNFQHGKRNFIFPGRKLPERLHNCTLGSFVSFWVRSVIPTIFLWILVKDDQDYVYDFKFSVHINGTKLDIASEWLLLSTIKTDHIFICDMQSIIHSAELTLGNRWNQVKISIDNKTQQIKGEQEIYFGVHVYNLQSNIENIRFMDPRIYLDNNLLQKIQEEEYWEELDGYMNLDSDSTQSLESIVNPMHYYQDQAQDREELEGDMHQVLDLVKFPESSVLTGYQDSESREMGSERLGHALGIREDLIKNACERAFIPHKDKPFLCEKSSSELIISFPPSWFVSDWFTDQTFGETKIDLSLFPSLKCISNDELALVHKASLSRFVSLLSNQSFISKVETATRDGERIVFTGHSSGGAMAILATLWKLEQETKRWNSNPNLPVCVTFGSPLVGNHIFSHATKREKWSRFFIHFVLRYDVVPRISLAPFSSVEQTMDPILQVLSQKDRSSSSSSDPIRYSEFYYTVMKNAAMAASHRACSIMGSTNLLLESVENFLVLSPYRPFGMFVLCTGNGRLIVMKNSEAVLQVLFHSAVLSEEGEGDEVAKKKVLQHLEYLTEVQDSLRLQNVACLDKIEEVPLSLEHCSNVDAANVDIALNDLGLGKRPRLCLRAAGELERKKYINEAKINRDKFENIMKELEDYKIKCRGQKVGYYDAFKLHEGKDDFLANMNRLKLAGEWEEIIEMLKRYELPDEFEGKPKWVKMGLEFLRLVEPLDIANHYRLAKNVDTGAYMVRGRPERYRYIQRWIEHESGVKATASLESCFWAETEELIIKTYNGVFDGDFKKRVEKLEEYLNRWGVKDEILKDVLLEETTFMKWFEGKLPHEYKACKFK